MNKTGTWASCGMLAAGVVAVGATVDRARGGRRATFIAGVLAGTYLVGSLVPRSPVFGRPVRTRREGGTFALTFDDGPDPRFTPRISRQLADRGHRATFFVLGRAVDAHPDIARLVLADGHELASHGDDHGLLGFASPGAVRQQLARAEAAIRSATGGAPARLFRAPHGVRSPWLVRTVRRSGYRLCGWNGAVFDTAQPGVEAIVDRVDRFLRPGAVVLLHDGDGSFKGGSREQTVTALPAILDLVERRGLRSVPLGMLLH